MREREKGGMDEWEHEGTGERPVRLSYVHRQIYGGGASGSAMPPDLHRHGGDGASNTLERLEPLQYEDLYREDDVPLQDVRDSALRVFVYAGIGLTVLFIALGFTVEIPRQLSFDFVLKGEQQEDVYRFFEGLYVEEKHVEVGSTVAAGAPLLKISSPQVVEMVTAYEDALARKRIFETTELPLYQSRLEAFSLQKAQIASAIEEHKRQKQLGWNVYQAELDKLTYLAEEAERKHARTAGLAEKNLVSQDDLERAKAAMILAKTELAALKENRLKDVGELEARIEAARLQQKIVTQQGQEKAQEAQSQLAKLENEVDQAYQALYRSYGNFEIEGGSLLLKAPHAGRVAYLTDQDRDVPSGATLLKILKGSSDLRAYTTVPPQAIGFVHPGDPVVLKVATFPHYEWGTLQGVIQHLSLTPDENGQYPCNVAITRAGKLAPHLQIGMNGELSVLVEEKSFFRYVFSHLEEGYDRVVG